MANVHSDDTATVEVKSGWASKINWTQAIGVIASILVIFGIDVDPATQAALVATINGLMGVVTFILRTFFTSKVTVASINR